MTSAPAGASHDPTWGGELSHIDGTGHARMVDVTGKPWTDRRALARCKVVFERTAGADDPGEGSGSPGDAATWSEVFATARAAGIQAAKQTAHLVPLCHPLTVSDVDVHLSPTDDGIAIEATARVVAPTGVEMEALTACAAAALTVVAAAGPGAASIEDLVLWEKRGGRSGTWLRQSDPLNAPR